MKNLIEKSIRWQWYIVYQSTDAKQIQRCAERLTSLENQLKEFK